MTEEFDDEEFPCDICGKVYATNRGLNMHKMKKHKEAKPKPEKKVAEIIKPEEKKVSNLDAFKLKQERIYKNINSRLARERAAKQKLIDAE